MSSFQSDSNGHSNTPHSEREKAFKIGPVQSPEEEARELTLKVLAPQIRRAVREDPRLSAPAKFLFTAIFDDCFWHQAGGHGTGRIFADIRTLADRYLHDEKSIRAWRDELIEAGWLWTSYEWPMSEWRITPLMPAPIDHKHKRAVQMSLGRKAEGNHTDTTPGNGKASKNGAAPSMNGQNSRTPRETSPHTVGKDTVERGNLYRDSVGQVPTGDGTGSHGVRATFPRSTGQVPTESGTGSHDRKEPNPASIAETPALSGQSRCREKAPIGVGSLGVNGAGDTPPDRDWEKWTKSLDKMFPRELETVQSSVKRQLAAARSAAAKTALKRKLAEIRLRLDGPPVPDDEPANGFSDSAPVSIISKIAQRQPTAEEIAEHEKFMAARKGAA